MGLQMFGNRDDLKVLDRAVKDVVAGSSVRSGMRILFSVVRCIFILQIRPHLFAALH